VWLLDVDGVINAVSPRWGDAPRQGQAQVLGTAYHLRWSKELIRRIRSVHEAGQVEIRWATTWVDHILQLERLMALPRLGTAFRNLDPDAYADAVGLKLDAAHRIVDLENRPLIWTDDDAIPVDGPLRDHLDAAPAGSLLIAPTPQHGLDPQHLDGIDAFIQRSSLVARSV
jgi:hypothetical protein